MPRIEMGELAAETPADWNVQGMMTLTLPSDDPNVKPNVIVTKEYLPKEVDLATYFGRIKESIENSKSIGAQFNDDVDTAAFKERVQPLVDETVNANDVRKTLYAAIQEANAAHPAG